MGDTLDTDSDTDTAMDSCTARGLLMLSPRPRQILTTDTVLVTPDIMVLDTLDTMDSDTMVDSCTARGLLMLTRILTSFTVDSDTPDTAMVSMDMDTDLATGSDTAMDLCTARGLLMLSLRLRLILTTMVLDTYTDWDTSDTLAISDTPDTVPDTTWASRLHQDLSVNQLGQKWIV